VQTSATTCCVANTFRTNTALGVGILLVALVFAMAVNAWVSIRGVVGPTIALAASPTSAALWTTVALAISLVITLGVARIINSVVALFVLGCGVGLLAMRAGTITDLSLTQASLLSLAVETVLWGMVVAAASIFIFRFGGPLPDAVEIENPKRDGVFGWMAFASLATGPLVLLGVWAIAVVPGKGQVLGATIVGGLLVGLAGRLVAPITPPALLFVAPMIFGAMGQAIAHLMLKGEPVRTAFVNETLVRFAYAMPIDYATGALVGVSLGVGMARSFIRTEAHRLPHMPHHS
jgi:hypothetical protein